MSIIERCKNLNNNIDKIIDLEKTKGETEDLNTINNELGKFLEKINFVKNKVVLFKTKNISFDVDFENNLKSNLKLILDYLTKIQKKFDEEPTIKSLKTKNYEYLKGKLDESLKNYDRIMKETWNNFCNEKYSGETIEKLKNSIDLATDNNKESFNKYQYKYNEFMKLKNNIPEYDTILSKISSLANELKEIYNKFDRNIPKDVKNFLNAVNSGGASLNLYTEEVKEWLNSKGVISEYKIKR